MARLYRRRKGGVWYADIQTDKGRVQRTLKTRDKTVAKRRLREAELAAPRANRDGKQRLGAAIEYVIGTMIDRAEATKDMYREKGRRIYTTLGDPWIHDIDRDMLQGYIKRRSSTEPGHGGAKPHTVQKELIVIRRALREAHERKLLHVMPAIPRFSAKYKPKEVWLTVDQFEAVCSELAPERRLWASIAALAGASAGEVERLTWGMVDLEARRMLLPGTKRETRRRTVPISPALAVRLEQAGPGRKADLVVGVWGNVRRDLHAAVKRANKKAGEGAEPVPLISPNDLRRTFASWLVQNGAPLLTVATLMGHSSTRMVEKVYGKLSQANLDAAIQVLPMFEASPVTKSDTKRVPNPPTPGLLRDGQGEET